MTDDFKSCRQDSVHQDKKAGVVRQPFPAGQERSQLRTLWTDATDVRNAVRLRWLPIPNYWSS